MQFVLDGSSKRVSQLIDKILMEYPERVRKELLK